MAKQYKLAAGINAGVLDVGTQEDNIQGYVYSNDLLDFFDKNINLHFNFIKENNN